MTSIESTRLYQPGVCNIGPAEIRQRRLSGWIGAVVTVIAVAALVIFHVPAPWRLLAGLPAILAATGFLQAALHFCVNFGMRGLFNVDAALGETESVMEADFRRADQRKAVQIIVYSVLIGIAVALIAFVIPS
jgi:hypothetical protein